MRIASVRIENFRSIQAMQICLDQFNTIVGQNNAGKSSLLLALQLLKSGGTLREVDRYDPDQDVVIEVYYTGITEDDLGKLDQSHARRIRPLLSNGELVLVRRFPPKAKNKLRCRRKVPKSQKCRVDQIEADLKGKRGSALAEVLKEAFPERASDIENATIKKKDDALEAAENFLLDFSDDQLTDEEADLPTGIDTSILPMIPEPIYIPAMKDVSDELKTKETSSFGKIVRALLELIRDTDELVQIRESLENLARLLNRDPEDNDAEKPRRLEDIQDIEDDLQKYLGEQFDNVQVEIQIPPVELKAILGTAQVFLHDGVRTNVDEKGDGMRRAVVFALLRALVDIQRRRANRNEKMRTSSSRYLFLFEEPELFLHPRAQRTLYDALRSISNTQQVLVSTHSPYFFSPSDSGCVIRLRKTPSQTDGPPRCASKAISLSSDIESRKLFQILCFENNNAAFFCDRVVLVEGKFDYRFLKHVSRLLTSRWDFDAQNIQVVQVGGKGNFSDFRSFFESFGVHVCIIADLDVVSDGFRHLGASEELRKAHAALQTQAAKVQPSDVSIKTEKLKKAVKSETFKQKYERCKAISQRICSGDEVSKEEHDLFRQLFDDHEDRYKNADAYRNSPKLRKQTEELLAQLRAESIVVLSRGAIEEYYPSGVSTKSKHLASGLACEQVTTREEALKLGGKVACLEGSSQHELSAIFDCIFSK
ncbi:AAA family ATPase [Gimesia maris]|uniref:AAA family ATPase n=1 Tax=Gimesia maris TaxID=122 RepID=UPI003A9594CE